MKYGKWYNIQTLEYKRKIEKQRRENIKILGLLFFFLFALLMIFYVRFILIY